MSPSSVARLVTHAVIAFALIALPASAVQGQEFAGYTYGCFVGAPSSACAPIAPAASLLPGATFVGVGSLATPSAFGTAVGGNLTLSNLGTLSVARQRGGSYNGLFTLGVFFTEPGGSGNFLASVIGTQNNGGNGSIVFNFGGPQLITFDGGSFNLAINDVTSQVAGNSQNGTVQITGSVTDFVLDPPTATVPEPSTVVLLGAGIAGLALARRRRRA